MKTNSSDKQQLYTSAETMKILDISSSTLRNLVDRGLIEKVTRTGYKHGYYTKKSVDQYHKENTIFDEIYYSDSIKAKGSRKRDEEKATTKIKNKISADLIEVKAIEEMRECQELSQEIFGVGGGTERERMRIVEKNPDTYHLLRREGEPVGYLSLMPLKKGNLENVLRQTIPVKIEPEQIEKFEKGRKLDLYITAIGIKPGVSTEEKREYGSKLIRQLIKLILELGEKGVEIETIAARSNMSDGIRLMKHVGFTEIVSPTPERRTFIINVKESGIPFLLQYKRDLEESKTRDSRA